MNLRPYQQECFDNILTELSKHKSTCVIAPTGSGKSLIIRYLAEHYWKTNFKQVIIVSHRKKLVTQTHEYFEKSDIDCQILRGNSYPNPHAKVIVSTIQSAKMESKIDRVRSIFSNDLFHTSMLDVGLIIVDESHQVGTDSYEKLFSMFPRAQIVGFSATQFRKNQISTNLFDSVAYSVSMSQLIEWKYLVPPVLHVVKQKSKNVNDIMAQIVGIYQKSEMNTPSVVFMQTIEDCKFALSCFTDKNIKAEVITSEVNDFTRDRIIDEFESGQCRVLITVDVLSEGVDIPCIGAIFMPYPTKSIVRWMQRIGRGLRLFKDKTHCNIYVVSNPPNIKSGLYDRIHAEVMTQGLKIQIGESAAIQDIGESTEDIRIKAEINKTVQGVSKIAEKLGLGTIHELVEKRQFPENLLNGVFKKMKEISNLKLPTDRLEPTIIQKSILIKNNIDVARLSRYEASLIISSLYK